MKWAVYWQPTADTEMTFFKTEDEAKARVAALIAECEALADEHGTPFWDITLLQVRGEVHYRPFGLGTLELQETK